MLDNFNHGENPIFANMEINAYRTKEEDPYIYMNFKRLKNEEYIRNHIDNKKHFQIEKLYVGDFYENEQFSVFNIEHYFPEGYAILPFYKKVNVKNLKLGQINQDKYIVLKIVSELYKVKAILFLGEDEDTNILKISIYNYSSYYKTNEEEELQKIFDVGKYIICINSFYKVYTSLDDGLRIESPAEIILLNDINELNYFFERNNNRNIIGLKELGNFFMQKMIYEKAIYYYSESISMIKSDKSKFNEEIYIITLSNLIEAYLKYGYYTKALLIANEGLKSLKEYNDKIKNKEGIINTKIELQKQKIIFRKIRALKGLRQFYKIYEFLNIKLPLNFVKNNLQIFDLLYKDYESNIKIDDILEIKDRDNLLNLPEFKNIISDLENKILNETGKYNFYDLLKIEQNNFELNCGDYYSHKIYLDYNYKKGIFIKAKEFIKKGELIIAEKAIFAINQTSTEKKDSLQNDIITYNTILERFKKFPDDYKKLNLLYNGINGNLNLKKRFDKIYEPMTQDKLANIIFKNRHSTRRSPYFPQMISSGLFYISSFINHSCDCNANYNGIGDFIILFSIKDINKDEEITISYCDQNEIYEKRKIKLDNWGINCNCEFCTNDIATRNKEYKIIYNEYIDFFQNYAYKANISKDELSIIYEKIMFLEIFLKQNDNFLKPYEKCRILTCIFQFYNFANEIEKSKLILKSFFDVEKGNYFLIASEILNHNLRFNYHLIEINYKEGENLFIEAKKKLIECFLKMTPYKEKDVEEMIKLNIQSHKNFLNSFKKLNLFE